MLFGCKLWADGRSMSTCLREGAGILQVLMCWWFRQFDGYGEGGRGLYIWLWL